MSGQQAGADLPRIDDLWNFGDPGASEARFRALLPRAEQSGNVSYRAQLLTQIARAQGLQRDFAPAHRTLDEAETLLDQTDATTRIRCLLERGRVFNSAGEADRARPFFLAAWDLASEHTHDAFAVDAAHMLGIVDPPPAGMEWTERALALAETSADPEARRWLGSLANNLGWAHHDAGDFAQALDCFQRALVWQRANGNDEAIRIARWSVARTLRSLGRIEEALAEQGALRAELAEIGGQDGYVDEELGECLMALGRPRDARPHFVRAYAALSGDPWLREQEPQRLQRLARLAADDLAPDRSAATGLDRAGGQ